MKKISSKKTITYINTIFNKKLEFFKKDPFAGGFKIAVISHTMITFREYEDWSGSRTIKFKIY